ncbi:MAG: voltage-gated potassium channel [Bacteroidota bacterium]|nr:voltage-gated potassium channel [Bacteroidota bacterium]
MLGFQKIYISRKPDLKRPLLPAFILAGVIVIGTIGYNILWKDTNSTLIDEIYMTFITITTIGFNEIYPLDTTGRIFTMIIGVLGIGSLFYILGILMENLVVLQISNYWGIKKKMKKIYHLSNHIILVGFGRVGRLTASELIKRNQKFVIIDSNMSEEIKLFKNQDLLYIDDDATEDSVLLRAGIKKAKGMIVATADSATSVFVVLSAKVLNPSLYIVARCDEDSSIEKLKRAGANQVVNPYSIGGQKLAQVLINPNMHDFLETSLSIDGFFDIQKIPLTICIQAIGKSLKELDIRRNSGATVLAVLRNNTPILNPDADFKVAADDILIAMGDITSLTKINEFLLA